MKNKILASIVVVILLMSSCAVVFNFAPAVSGDTMYYLEVKTQPEGIVYINGTGWYTNSSTVHLDAPPIVDSPRYRFVVWNVDGVNKTLGQNPINVPIDNKNHTAIAIYIGQYHLTMTTGYESLGVLPWTYNGSWYQTNDGGWFDEGSTAYVGISGLDGSEGVYVTPVAWAHFESFTVPGRNAWPGPQQFYSDPITMTSDLAVAANWRMQYYLYVKTDKYDPWPADPNPGQSWYWEGTIVTLTAPEGPSSPPPPAGSGWWWMFDRWEVTGTENLYFDKSVNVTMNSNKTATVFYKAMYYLWVYDWPLNATSLYTYSGWYENCTYVTMTADDTIPAGPGTRYKFYAWYQYGVGYFSTDLEISVHINSTYLPIRLEACYKLQYELTVQTDPTGVVTIPGAGWYDSGAVVPLTAPDPVPVDSSSRYRFSQWVKDPGGYTDSNNATTITMNGPRTATAYYNAEFKLIVDDDQGSSFYWEYWWQNCTNAWTGWWCYSDLGGFTPSMPTMVFNHWTVIQGGVSTEWAEGVNDWVHINAPTTLIAHYLNETYIILAAGSDVDMEAPGAYCTPFDVDVIFANFNAERHVGGKAMDLYGVEFTITWDPSLIELTGYTAYLDNIWPTGSFIQAEQIDNVAGTFLFAAHAINTYEGFEGTRVMLILHFHVIYEPCYNIHPSTTIRMNPYKLANHLDERIYPEHTDWCTYSIHALKPKLVLEPSVDRFEYINEQNRVFSVDVMGYNFVKIKDYHVKVTWDIDYLKCLNVIVSEDYFQPPYLKKAYSINNNNGWLTVDLEIDYDQGSPKVNGTALLFTIVFEIVLDQNYPAWWAPNHEAYKIDVAFDTVYTKLSGQCEPWGTDNEIFTSPTRLTLVDADPWYTPYIGDLNYDGHIDLDDLMLIRMDYHGSTYDISWGQGSTGIVDIFDAVLVALNLWTGPLDD